MEECRHWERNLSLSSSDELSLSKPPKGHSGLHPSSCTGGVPGQLGGKSGLLGTKCASATGEVAGDPEAEAFSRSAADKRQRRETKEIKGMEGDTSGATV